MDFAEAKVFADSLLARRAISRWELLEYVSHGKSAVVLRGRRDQTQVAIKVFHPGLIEHYGRDAQLVRIDRERMLIGKHHANMVRVLDAGCCEVTDLLFVVMDFAPGRPLSDVITLIPRKNIASLIDQLASAALQLENWGFTHRDIKPGNIHVDDHFSSLMLLDFGVLKPHGDNSATSLQASKAFIGTHQYSPPEMIHGREEDTVDGWRAITFYQIGAVLHDVIARKPIFEYATTRHADLVTAIDNDRVEVSADDVDPRLCNLATRCLLKNPHDRLDLIRWGDFMVAENELEKPSFQARKDVLQRQIRLGKVLARVDVIEDAEKRRLKEIRFLTIVRSIRAQFDYALADLADLMPTRSTEINGGTYPSPAITYTFDPASNSSLPLPFRIQVAVATHDDRDIVHIYARASKGLAETEVGWTDLGSALESLDGFSELFEEWMISIIEELVTR